MPVDPVFQLRHLTVVTEEIRHDGGPARSFDRRMPAFGEALTEAELRHKRPGEYERLVRSGDLDRVTAPVPS